MNSKALKIYYIIAGSFAGLAILYYIARIIDSLVNEYDISDTLFGKLNIVAIIFLAIALVMLIVGVLITSRQEKKLEQTTVTKQRDQELLAKYKTKKK